MKQKRCQSHSAGWFLTWIFSVARCDWWNVYCKMSSCLCQPDTGQVLWELWGRFRPVHWRQGTGHWAVLWALGVEEPIQNLQAAGRGVWHNAVFIQHCMFTNILHLSDTSQDLLRYNNSFLHILFTWILWHDDSYIQTGIIFVQQ